MGWKGIRAFAFEGLGDGGGVGSWTILRACWGGVDCIESLEGPFVELDLLVVEGTLVDLAFLRGLGSCFFLERPSDKSLGNLSTIYVGLEGLGLEDFERGDWGAGRLAGKIFLDVF